jgi:ferrochelatase
LLPLYAQYSTTTTKSSFEDIDDALKKLNYNPSIKKIYRFYKDENFNLAIVHSIKNSLSTKEYAKYDLVFSAHSLPKKIIKNGDTYQIEIEEHIDILKNLLLRDEVKFNEIHLAYQSKLGPVEWLEPSLEDKLKTISNKNVLIYPISFTLDNSETDLELDIEYKELANKLGFCNYKVVKCLNDDNLFTKAIISLTRPLSLL